jgi:hypothetical protein
MLDGMAAINYFGGSSPALGNSWSLVTATGGVSGAFSTVAAPWLPADMALFVDYGAAAVTATLVTRIAGDFNGDSRVDATDYAVWRKKGGTQAEYESWRSNFGSAHAGSGRTAPGSNMFAEVPEPSTIPLLLLTLAAFLHRRQAS